VNDDRTVLAPAMPAMHAAPAAAVDGSGIATMTPWKREALPDVEASLARQIGPMARFLLKKVADKADGLDHLAELLLPHIPSEVGREQFGQAVAQIRKKLDATGTGSGATRAPGLTSLSGAAQPTLASTMARPLRPESFDAGYADATADKLVAIIGPIGRVLVKRAMKQTADKQAFLQLIAGHIDNPGERTRFLADAGAGAGPGP
jgi:serine/threonine-protein kinase